ncbi:MAG: hypothetical protein FJX77_12155, partial [Armatimonadetes bacterium]|nr:hypothetical protein [Armatimonadota bacterium]
MWGDLGGVQDLVNPLLEMPVRFYELLVNVVPQLVTEGCFLQRGFQRQAQDPFPPAQAALTQQFPSV